MIQNHNILFLSFINFFIFSAIKNQFSRYVECFNNNDIDGVMDIYASEFTRLGPNRSLIKRTGNS